MTVMIPEDPIIATPDDTEARLIGLIADYARTHPQRTCCFTDTATVLGWLERDGGFVHHLQRIRLDGGLSREQWPIVFGQALRTHCAQSKAA